MALLSEVVDVGSSDKFSHHQLHRCPTLTAARGSSNAGFYAGATGSCLSKFDKARLMGVPPQFYHIKHCGVSKNALLVSHLYMNVLSSIRITVETLKAKTLKIGIGPGVFL